MFLNIIAKEDYLYLVPLAVSCKCSDKILISPPKYRNPNNRIHTPVARFFTAKLHIFSPELPAYFNIYLKPLDLSGKHISIINN